MRREDQTTRPLVAWSMVLICWTVIGVFFIGRNIVLTIIAGQPLAWHRNILFELIYWYLWAFLTPLIFWSARRFLIAGEQKLRNGIAATLFGLFIAALHTSLDFAINLTLAWKVIRVPEEELRRVLSAIVRGMTVEAFTGFIIYWIILGAYYAFNYYQKYRQREITALELERQLAQAEMQNLKMQLHPHFLFNTLNAISVLMLEDVHAANRMLVRLGDLLRMTLENTGTQEVSLKQEVEFLQKYLEIEQTRFSDRLTVIFDIEPATLDARVPYLILQPLVENAIRHAIAPRASAGLIEIKARRKDGAVKLQVVDDGPGLERDNLEGLTKGIGLTNTEARLERLYGSAYSFDLKNGERGGLEAIVIIPFRPESERADGNA